MIRNKKFIITFIITLLFSSEDSSSPNYYSNSWGLIIGINKYTKTIPLNYAVEDAEDISALLIESFDFPEDNIQILLDEEATLMNIKRALVDLSEKTKKGDRVIIYFAGHGETDALATGGERGYLLPVNGDKDDLYLTSLPMDEVRNFSTMTAAKDVLFLMDACYSGLLGITGTRGFDEKRNYSLEKIAKGGSRQVITAGRKGQVSIEKPEWGHSAFAKNLIKGLEDGMADYDDDGVITGTELGLYLTNKVTQDSEGKQTPNSARFTNDEGEFVFVNIIDKVENLTIDTVENLTINNTQAIQTGNNSSSSVITITEEGTVLIDSSFFSSDTKVPQWLENSLSSILEQTGIADKDSSNSKLDLVSVDEWVEEFVGLDDSSEEETLNLNSSFSKSPTWHFGDEDGDSDHWVRYNRSEGFYLQLNGTFQSPNIPGSSFYGGIGRAFHRNEWQYIIGLEQLISIPSLFIKRFIDDGYSGYKIQVYFEGFNKSITNDAWRMSDYSNSVSAFFLSKDYLDWYNGTGYRGAVYFHINNYISIGGEYNRLTQSNMNNVLEEYRPSYKIQEGENIYLKSALTIGYPVDISIREEFQMYSSLIRTNSMKDSGIDYNHDHFFFNILIPYTDELNFDIKLMAGASDVIDDEFKQNIFELGGNGSLRGYDWKTFATSHYQLSTLEIWYDEIGFFYDRAMIFDSPGNTFNQDYLNDLIDNVTEDIHHSIGLSFGDSDARVSFAQNLTGNKKTTMYISFGEPLQYW